MTEIMVKCDEEVASHYANFRNLLRRLSLVPMIVLGSPDVQMTTGKTHTPIRQYVMNAEGIPSRVEDSSIALSAIHVHDVPQVDNDLFAKAMLAAVWGSLQRHLITNPNSFVVQNGSSSFGWAEGAVSPAEAEDVVKALDDFWHKSLKVNEANALLRVILLA